MQILLANAKIMYDQVDAEPWSKPQFQPVANQFAEEMATLDIDQLSQLLGCSRKLAAQNWKRYQNFFCTKKQPAIMSYNGQAYKHLRADTLGEDALSFAQQHLWITCFLYGLLRPMDGIVPYRMEYSCLRRGRKMPGGANLLSTNHTPIGQYWKNVLTDVLIQAVRADDGVLVHLSTAEYEHLFDWRRVCDEVEVIQPLFYVRQSDGALRMQAVWAKSCRGAMVRYILQNQIQDADELKAFGYEGFEYNPRLGEALLPHFVRQDRI